MARGLCTGTIALGGLPLAAFAAPVTQAIKHDHFGYRPADTKIAIFTQDPGATIEIRTTTDDVVFRVPADGGSIVSKGADGAPSGDTVWWVDFSPLTSPGVYHLYSVSLAEQSYDFEIREDLYNSVMRQALKTFYYQWCNTPKASSYAGAWADDLACHMTDLERLRRRSNQCRHARSYRRLARCGRLKITYGEQSRRPSYYCCGYEDNPDVFADDQLGFRVGNGIPICSTR